MPTRLGLFGKLLFKKYITFIQSFCIGVVFRSSHINSRSLLSCLLVLLRETVTNGVPSKMQQLVMKCLWRITRNLASCIEEYRIEAVLQECHVFLKAYPSSYWQVRSQIVKKVFFYISRSRGTAIRYLILSDLKDLPKILLSNHRI